jgi:hypothetical protein
MVKVDSNLLAAFVGAVTGGAASLAGSVFVGRRDLTRKTRIHMYHDLIPPLQEEISRLIGKKSQDPEPRKEIYEGVEALARESVVAGRIDSKRLAVLQNLCADQQKIYDKREMRSKGGPRYTVEIDREFTRLRKEAESREEFLAKRNASPVIRQYRAAEAQLQKDLEEYAADFFRLDQSIAKQLNEMQEFLRRKIR